MAHISMVTLGVTDVDAAAEFYVALGWERSEDSVAGTVAFLRGGACVLGLFGREDLSDDAAGTPLPSPPGPVTLATNLDSPEAVDDLIATAEAAGATVVKRGQEVEWGGYSGYVADPDGHLWEVAHNPFWTLEADGRVRLGDHPGAG